MNELLEKLSPILTGILTVGLTAFFTYLATRPKSKAEGQKLNADVVVTFADGWKKLYDEAEGRVSKLEARMLKMEETYTKRIKELEQLIEAKDKAHARIVVEKDKRIDELENRVQELEIQVEKYKSMEVNVEKAKIGLHSDVDQKLEEIKKK